MNCCGREMVQSTTLNGLTVLICLDCGHKIESAPGAVILDYEREQAPAAYRRYTVPDERPRKNGRGNG